MHLNAARIHFGTIILILSAACSDAPPGPLPSESPSHYLDDARSRFMIQSPAQIDGADHLQSALPQNEGTRLGRVGDSVGVLGSSGTRTSVGIRADQPFAVGSSGSTMLLNVRLQDAIPQQGQVAEGYVVYPAAHRSGATVLRRLQPDGVEEYVAFEAPPASESIAYDVELSSDIAGLRLVSNTLEFLDGQGTPRLHVAPPYLIDSSHANIPAALSVTGCAVDTDPRFPWGRTPTPPGASHCRVQVDWSGARVSYPALLDPAWLGAGNMIISQSQVYNGWAPSPVGTAAVGTDGRQMFMPGQVFDLATSTWAATANPHPPAVGVVQDTYVVPIKPKANQLDGQPLVLYVASVKNGGAAPLLVQTFDPSTGVWANASVALPQPNSNQASVLLALPSGDALFAGGVDPTTGQVTTRIARFNHLTGAWIGYNSQLLPICEYGLSAVVMQNGKVFFSGGTTTPPANPCIYAQIFDPVADVIVKGPPMSQGRVGHTSVLESNGNILVGDSVGGAPTTEEYNLATNLFNAPKPTPGNRTGFQLATQFGGPAMLIGGDIHNPQAFDFLAGAWHGDPAPPAPALAAQFPYVAHAQHDQIIFAGGTGPLGGATATEVLTSSEAWGSPAPFIDYPVLGTGQVNDAATPNLYLIYYTPYDNDVGLDEGIYLNFLSALSGSIYETSITGYYGLNAGVQQPVTGNFNFVNPPFTEQNLVPVINPITSVTNTTAMQAGNDTTLLQDIFLDPTFPFLKNDPNGIYIIVLGPGVTVANCGFFSWHTPMGQNTSESVVIISNPRHTAPAPACQPMNGMLTNWQMAVDGVTSCWQAGHATFPSPNGSQAADFTVLAMGHEVNEAVTDPDGANGWLFHHAQGVLAFSEIADECQFQPTCGSAAETYPAANGQLADSHIGAHDYYLQQLGVSYESGFSYCEESFTDLENLFTASAAGETHSLIGRFENVNPPTWTLTNSAVQAPGHGGAKALHMTVPAAGVHAKAVQTTFVPPGFKHLILSFWYQGSCSGTATQSGTYSINGGAPVQMLPPNCAPSNGWQYVQQDLSAAAPFGHDLTLTFDVVQANGAAETFELDDVMLVEYGH